MIAQPKNARLLAIQQLALPMILLCCLLCAFQDVKAQHPNPESAPTNTAPMDREKIAIEREKLELEKARSIRERRQFFVTIVSIAIPIIVLGITLWVQARTAYKLHAMQIIMDSKGSDAARKKVAILKPLLPRSLTRAFEQALAEGRMPGTGYQEKKLELFKAMSAKAGTDGEVFRIFQALYLIEPTLINEFINNFKTISPNTSWVSELREVGKQKR
ncbi:MAG: hypothetical protein AABM67_00960 [Acidobacteriota bacterium]